MRGTLDELNLRVGDKVKQASEPDQIVRSSIWEIVKITPGFSGQGERIEKAYFARKLTPDRLVETEMFLNRYRKWELVSRADGEVVARNSDPEERDPEAFAAGAIALARALFRIHGNDVEMRWSPADSPIAANIPENLRAQILTALLNDADAKADIEKAIRIEAIKRRLNKFLPADQQFEV